MTARTDLGEQAGAPRTCWTTSRTEMMRSLLDIGGSLHGAVVEVHQVPVPGALHSDLHEIGPLPDRGIDGRGGVLRGDTGGAAMGDDVDTAGGDWHRRRGSGWDDQNRQGDQRRRQQADRSEYRIQEPFARR